MSAFYRITLTSLCGIGLACMAVATSAADDVPLSRAIAQPRISTSPIQGPFQVTRHQAMKQAMDAEHIANEKRLGLLRANLAARKSVAVKFGDNAANCAKGPLISEVTPSSLMPGDPVLVTGCGFMDNIGMLLISDNNNQLKITRWSDKEIEATIPAIQGFTDPKNVTLSVVTVAAGKSAPSQSLTLKPTLVLKEIVPVGVTMSGCGDRYQYGIVEHTTKTGDPSHCGKGEDTVQFGIQLKNNWAFHSLIFTKLCTANLGPCGGANNATLIGSAYQLGKTYLPDLKVNWQGYVAYYPAIMVMGPSGTEPR